MRSWVFEAVLWAIAAALAALVAGFVVSGRRYLPLTTEFEVEGALVVGGAFVAGFLVRVALELWGWRREEE